MGEINTAAGASRHGGAVRKSKKLSTRVDLTPMVDLGFLLITFFIVTTTLSEPKAMNLIMPSDKPVKDPPTLGNSTALTLIPFGDNKVFFYHGILDEAMKNGSYGVTSFALSGGIGDIIRQKQLALDRNSSLKREDLMLLIKPANSASYQMLVNALDEPAINLVIKYALLDLSLEEIAVLKEKGIPNL
jgi:hypothetical protein